MFFKNFQQSTISGLKVDLPKGTLTNTLLYATAEEFDAYSAEIEALLKKSTDPVVDPVAKSANPVESANPVAKSEPVVDPAVDPVAKESKYGKKYRRKNATD